MLTRAQKARLGVFLVVCGGLFVGAVLTLAGMKLFHPLDRYTVRTKESVSGLDVGSQVKLNGVRVGRVDRLRVDPREPEWVRLTLALDAGTPVRVDTRAVISSVGITGLKYIELTLPPKDSPPLRPGSEIAAGESKISELTGKAQDIALKTEALITNLLELTREENRLKVESILARTDNVLAYAEELADTRGIDHVLSGVATIIDAIARTLRVIDSFVGMAETEVDRIGDSADDTLAEIRKGFARADIRTTMEHADRVLQSLRKRIEDEGLTSAVDNLAATVDGTKRVVDQLEENLSKGGLDLRTILTNLKEASDNLTDFTRAIKERPSLLLSGETYPERRLP